MPVPTPAPSKSAGGRVGASMTEMLEAENRSRLMMIGGGAVALLMAGWAYLHLFSVTPIDGKVLTSPDECAAFGSAGIDECTELWRQGLIKHANTAPAYPTIEACERNHGAGRCVSANRSTIAERQGRFTPAMVAILPVAAPTGLTVTPLYRDPGDGPDQWRQVSN